MNCDTATSLLLDRLASRLDERARAALDEHLETCQRCREAYAAQSEVSRLLAGRPDADVRPGFAARLAGRLEDGTGWFGLADWRWLSLRLAPVAAVLLLVAGLLIERQTADSSPRPSLASVVDTWASGGGGDVPVTSVLWQQQASEDAAVLTVLAAPPDATIPEQTNER